MKAASKAAMFSDTESGEQKFQIKIYLEPVNWLQSQTSVYMIRALLCFVQASRYCLYVLLPIHLSVAFAVSRELVLRLAKDLVDLVRVGVHPTSSSDVHFIFLFVELDMLQRRIVSRQDLITGSAGADFGV